ncbi:MAG: nucleotidyltransferase [Nanoarchaeota archaeon]|nr:nucleotidyltransferase [Nanoarchaeota archaeon]
METEIRIIKHLIENRKEFTIRELSKSIKSDYKITHTAVKRLIDKDIISSKNIGKSILIKFKDKLAKEVLEVEFVRREDILKNKNIKVMLDNIKNNIKTVGYILILFGSYAKKIESAKSDIDLIFIVSNIKIEKEIDSAISLLPLNIHHHVFLEKQFLNMKNSQESNIVTEAIKNNVILHGIEGFYELINKGGSI